MQKGERILSAVLNNVKFELLLTIHTNLSANLKEVVANIHEAFNYSPPMQLLTYFKNFDIDLAFESTEEMTNDIKNEVNICPFIDSYYLEKYFKKLSFKIEL